MSDHPVSQYYAKQCLKTWESFGYHVTHFEAVTPLTLEECSGLSFGLKRNVKSFTLTERSIWYSHFHLWKKCIELNETIVVIEHDCYLYDYLPTTEVENIHYFTKSISKKIISKGHFGRISPAGGYILSPQFAQKLIDLSVEKDIVLNVDGFMITTFDGDQDDEDMIAMQLVHDDVGTTIQH